VSFPYLCPSLEGASVARKTIAWSALRKKSARNANSGTTYLLVNASLALRTATSVQAARTARVAYQDIIFLLKKTDA